MSTAEVVGITTQVSSVDHPEYIGLLTLVRVARDNPTKPPVEAP
jgi:ribosomal protein L31